MKENNSGKPVIGFVFIEGRKTNQMYMDNLRESAADCGVDCEVRPLEVEKIMDEFKKGNAETYAQLLEQYPPKKEINGVVTAPNIDVETPDMESTKSPGAKLKEFLTNYPSIQGINAVAAPGDVKNVVEPGINENPDRMYFEKAFYSIVKDRGIPALGVCGTEQHIAHFAGAQIVNDVEQRTGHDHNPKFEGKSSGEVHSHEIIVDKGSMLAGYLPKDIRKSLSKDSPNPTIAVNSIHTQGVLISPENKKILDKAGFEISAAEPKEKIVEGYESKYGAPIIQTQFHPEFDNAQFERNILKGLAKAAETNYNKQAATQQIQQKGEGVASGLRHVKEKETGEYKQQEHVGEIVKKEYLSKKLDEILKNGKKNEARQKVFEDKDATLDNLKLGEKLLKDSEEKGKIKKAAHKKTGSVEKVILSRQNKLLIS
ncbi:MAG: hypothetical protein COV35_06030 [Alphaproteobacteria bacterium CG11_big_fil_rev_8_21_14_0_20_39_49]|nr:MAG: hypothetical protein COV35_06030 [Alphaproteobacteria bacterium CG11_big_fil_rev_8_21_14_0_20_39_49]